MLHASSSFRTPPLAVVLRHAPAYVGLGAVLLSVCALLYLLACLFLRVRSRFWSMQPVHHWYQWYRGWGRPYVIRPSLPARNLYVRTDALQTLAFDQVAQRPEVLEQAAAFLREHYFRQQDGHYRPEVAQLAPYFQGHNDPCFWTLAFGQGPSGQARLGQVAQRRLGFAQGLVGEAQGNLVRRAIDHDGQILADFWPCRTSEQSSPSNQRESAARPHRVALYGCV